MIPDKKSTDFNTNGASSIDIIFKHFYSSDDDVTVDQCLAEWNLLMFLRHNFSDITLLMYISNQVQKVGLLSF
jgi:hypothetical protein